MLLLNLLIAILSNVYEELITRVDSEYRSVLIQFYNKFRWDDGYGLFILLPSPITWVIAVISPILILSRKPSLWNYFFSKVFYILFVIPQWAIFVGLTAVYVPFVYLRAFIPFGKVERISSVQTAVAVK